MRRALMGLAIVLGCQMGDVALAADKSWAEILGAPKGEIPAPQPSVPWRLDVGDAMKFAQAENRPLFVTMRCLPCKQCSAFDKNVFEAGPEISPLLKQLLLKQSALLIMKTRIHGRFAMQFMEAPWRNLRDKLHNVENIPHTARWPGVLGSRSRFP